jgi:hypothetical protein
MMHSSIIFTEIATILVSLSDVHTTFSLICVVHMSKNKEEQLITSTMMFIL